MELKDLDLNKSYTYADYLTWKFEETVELIRGKIFRMSPAPNRYHQEISGNLFFKIQYFLVKQLLLTQVFDNYFTQGFDDGVNRIGIKRFGCYRPYQFLGLGFV